MNPTGNKWEKVGLGSKAYSFFVYETDGTQVRVVIL